MSKLQALCGAGLLALSGTVSAAESAGVIGDNLIPIGIAVALVGYALVSGGCKRKSCSGAEACAETPAVEETAAAAEEEAAPAEEPAAEETPTEEPPAAEEAAPAEEPAAPNANT